jgi:pyridoxamine 5'-phosphate oxidase
MAENLTNLRSDYTQGELIESEAGDDPIALLQSWLDLAIAAKLPEPNAMTLATATPQGRPSGRVVLLRQLDEQGLVFFTNYNSRKGQEITANPWVALTFWWGALEKQVRITGTIAKITEAESLAYFQSRPRASQLGAWASDQSQIIPDRQFLEAKLQCLQQQYPEGMDIPKPTHWGGFRVTPMEMEFWQGRRSRLHDRLLFQKQADNHWSRCRLAP